jgi:hypothetical protein
MDVTLSILEVQAMISKSEMRRRSVLDPAWAAERIYELEQEVLHLKRELRAIKLDDYSEDDEFFMENDE